MLRVSVLKLHVVIAFIVSQTVLFMSNAFITAYNLLQLYRIYNHMRVYNSVLAFTRVGNDTAAERWPDYLSAADLWHVHCRYI